MSLDTLRVIDIVFCHSVLKLARITDAYSNVFNEPFLLLLMVSSGLNLLNLLPKAILFVKVKLYLPVFAFVMLSLLFD